MSRSARGFQASRRELTWAARGLVLRQPRGKSADGETAHMAIRIEGLRKSYGASVAVDGVDIAVPEGKMLVLLGPSGCGKTTTMRCIAGLEQPEEGVIAIGQRTVFSHAGRINVAVNERRVGMVFQSYAIWPHMSVYENVAYPLDMTGVARAEKEKRVTEILRVVGLEGFGERGASYLSGGQMQRVALARSLVMRPSVLLFDEPLSNLDARLRDHLRVQLRELQTTFGITSVYVTHDQREALALADEIAVMQAGKVVQRGDPVSLYRRPKTSSIADFLGYSNIFDATLADGGANPRVSLDGQACVLETLDAPPAGPISVCVRPDDITVRARDGAGSPAPGMNRLEGDIVLASFMGPFYQYRVRLPQGAVWEAYGPADARGHGLGERVLLDVPASAVLVAPRT
ncbi:MAG: hypothetical protein JWN93_3576 [Hyphomicrobiales bacterium]|nr:hypothetical protein [Hyphomicrobiales bacterium]